MSHISKAYKNIFGAIWLLIFGGIALESCSHSAVKNEGTMVNPAVKKRPIVMGNFQFETGYSKDTAGPTFFMSVDRMAEGKEYFPNSERLRLEVFSAEGELLWASNSGVNYMQMIGVVEPQKVLESFTYQIHWDRQTISKARAKAGDYKARLSLMMKPMPLTTEFFFSIPE